MTVQPKRRRIKFFASLAAAVAGTGMAVIVGARVFSVPSYAAIRVFDGDTFETAEHQYIRLSGIDAPEMGRCGSNEAKKELETLVLGKKLYIKVLYHDGARLNGLVYSNRGFVNALMLKSGWAVMYQRDPIDMTQLQQSTDEARSKHIGIFAARCTQFTNADKPGCAIKGNIRANGDKTYHVPGCQTYDRTAVQLYNGDRWFCTEADARRAGFVKATQCP